jgi:hypothetical protein
MASYADRLLLGSLGRRAKLEVPHEGTLQWTFKYETKPADRAAEGDERPFVLVLGLAAKSVEPGEGNLLKTEVNLLPASLLGLKHNGEWKYTRENGRLNIQGPGFHALFDVANARIVIRTKEGALAAERLRIDQRLAGATSYDPATPWHSLLCMVLDERQALASPSDQRLHEQIAAWKALGKLVQRWRPLLDKNKSQQPKTAFKLPNREVPDFYDALFGPDPHTRRQAAGVLLGWHRRIAPKDGWLWPLGRDALLGFVNELAAEEVGPRAKQQDVGPVGELLFVRLGVERDARAAIGKASLQGFREEYAPLLTGDGVLSEWLLSLAEAARSLEEDELRALSAFVEDEAVRRSFARALTHLKQQPSRPTAEVLAESLDQFWQEGLGNKVRLAFLLRAHLEEQPRTAAASPSPQAAPQAPETPLKEPLDRLEMIERELQEAAAKQGEKKVERLPPVEAGDPSKAPQ